MRSVFVSAVIILSGTASGQVPADKPSDVRATIDKGLAFLAKDAMEWKKQHSCVSCHHASMVVWSMREAKLHGYAIDEPVLTEMTTWIVESGNGKSGGARPTSAPKAFNAQAMWFSLALGADPKPDDASRKGLKALLETVKDDQNVNGSWSAWPETRPPMQSNSNESISALATLAVLPEAGMGDNSAKAVRDKSVQWLAETKTDDDPQSIAMRLVIWQRVGRPAEEMEPLVRRIKDRQNADGGWSQSKDMASDAWATGQALYALAHGGIKSEDQVIVRAQAFLSRTQRPDGSWPMTSRPTKPGGEGAKNLIPITGAGSAWAILGLVRSR